MRNGGLRVVLAGLALGGFGACSYPVELYCDEETPCQDPGRPFCDLNGDFEASEGIGRTCIPDPFPDAGVGAFSLTVAINGDGEGSVVSSPDGIDCDRTTGCVAEFPAGTQVTLTATPDSSSVFAGWQGGGCSGTAPCLLTVDAGTSVSAGFDIAPNFVFVTSTVHQGNFGGLSAADSICNQRAAAAGLPGTYRAWISTATVDAISRLTGARGWVRVDGVVVADARTHLGQGRLFNPIRLDELGNDVGAAEVYTGTEGNGTKANSRCNDWTSSSGAVLGGVGRSDAGGTVFASANNVACSGQRRLYCFGVDRSVAVAPPEESGRLAFVTKSGWIVGGGILSADALCQSEANQAGLPGTYRALLATTTASAASRFSTTGLPWRRVDGVRITQSAPTMFQGGFFDSFLNLTADGQTYESGLAWSGSTSMTLSGAANRTCDNWTTTADELRGSGGLISSSHVGDFLGASFPQVNCATNAARLACLQL